MTIPQQTNEPLKTQISVGHMDNLTFNSYIIMTGMQEMHATLGTFTEDFTHKEQTSIIFI